MVGAINQALGGIHAGFDRLNSAASRIANDGADGDLSGNMVALVRSDQEIQMNLKVIRAADSMIGSLLDVWA
jgi:hypothetical protein